MKKFTKLTSLLLLIVTLFQIIGQPGLAMSQKDLINNKFSIKNDDTYLLEERIFKPDGLNNQQKDGIIIDKNSINPQYVDPEVGTVKISDELRHESGSINGDLRNFTDFNIFKLASITIIKRLPYIGQYVEKGQEIYDALAAVNSDLRYINKSKEITTQTWHTFRDFYHWLYVLDYGSWKDMGHSVSRYFYKRLSVTYYNYQIGEYRRAEHSYTHSRGYGPCSIAKAPNYMRHAQLRDIVYDNWRTNSGKHTEYYR